MKKAKFKTFQEYYEDERVVKCSEDSWDNAAQRMLNSHAKLISHLEARVLELKEEIENIKHPIK